MKEGHVCSIRERTKGLAGHLQYKNKLSQKDGTQTRRTIRDQQSIGTSHL